MTKHKIVHFKQDCISCGACAAINPDFWKMDEEGLAQLKKSSKKGEKWELSIDEKDVESNQEAADVCPVNIIHLEEDSEN